MRLWTPIPLLVAAALAGAPSALAADPAPTSPPPPDTTAPLLSDVLVSAPVVKVATGASVRFSLSEVANVAGAVSEHRAGRLVSGRCVPGAAIRAAGKHRRARKSCTKLVRLGSFYVANAPAGPNVAKLGLKALKPGRYQVTLTPRDRTGNLGAAATVELRVVA
jgi:hypothetical protein